MPGGHVVFTSPRKGWYALDSWRDSEGHYGMVYHQSNSLRQAYLRNAEWCSENGRTVTRHRDYWRETLGYASRQEVPID